MANTRELSQLASVISVADETRNVGIGTTNPTSKLHVSGDVRVSGAITATTFVGALTGTASNVTTNANLTGHVTSVGNAAVLGSFTSLQLLTALTDETGTGANVFATSPTLVTPVLGTPSSGTLTNCTGLPISTGVSGLAANISTFLAIPSSANLAAALTDDTGSGAAVFATSPTLVTPVLGAATATSIVVGSGVTINASGINASGIVTTSQLSTGASGTGINITTDTISGPATLTIDPAAVGDNTGAVRIKGDLYVDGDQFIVNSTTIELADFNVGIATTVGTNALLDGAGIGIGSIGIRKTIQWDNGTSSLKSSESFNLNVGKTYKINGTDVLSNTTLGSGVTNSSLTSVGTLGSLSVGNVNSTGVVTATTFVGALTGTASSTTNIPNLTGAITSVNTTTTLGSFSSANLATALTDETGSGSAVFATSPTLVTPVLGAATATSIVVGSGVTINASGINASGIITATTFVGALTGTASSTTNIPNLTGHVTSVGNAAVLGSFTSLQLLTALTDETGTGANVFATSPTLVTPVLGTPSSGTLTSCTGLPVSTGISGLAANVATFLATPSSANLISAVTDETGTGALVFATSPTLVTPVLGAASATSIVVGSGITINASGINATAGVVTASSFVGDGSALTGISGGSSSQFVTTSVGIHTLSNVGIGTTNPTSKLHVSGDVRVSGVVTATSFSGNVTATSIVVSSGSTFTNGPILVGTATSTGTASQKLQVTGGAYVSGNLGIGTANPTVALQLSPTASISNLNVNTNFGTTAGAAATVAQFYHSNGNASYLRIKATRNATGGDWFTASTKLLQVIDVTEQGYVEFNPNGANYGMAFGQSGTEWARFLSGGNLGIGTTTPTSKLHIIGDVRVSGITTTAILNVGTGGTIITTTSAGLVGIGTTNPLQKLHVLGNLLVAAGSSTGQHITQKAYELNSGTLSWEGSAGQLFSITNNLTSGSIFSVNDVSGIPSIDVDANGTIELSPFGGNVGVGTTNPTSKLHVVGDVRVTGIVTATDFNSTSDISLKDNIQTIANPLDKIIKLNGVTFNWKENQKPSIGVIAQELEAVLPELVTQGDVKSVNYNGLIGVLIEAVKEQQKQIEELKAIVKN